MSDESDWIERRTLRKGRPRFVVFIMWEEVPGSSTDGMAVERERGGGGN
jgi:hypothetical protein